MSSALYRYGTLVILIIILCFGVGFGYLFLSKLVEQVGGDVFASSPLPDLSSAPTQSTKIFDRDGNLLYEVGSVHRQTVKLSDVPTNVKNAFLAAEDKSFYTNPGFSFRSILRAAHTDVKSDQLLQGGSTITQQLAQQLVVSKQSSLARKVREIIVAVTLTQKYPKDTILERYLNEVPVGGDLVGVGTAAQTYFGEPVSKLTTAQGAYIAALINAPSTLDPYRNLSGLTDRQQLVLDRMANFGFISRDAANKAKQEKVTFLPRQTVIHRPYFSLYVKDLITEEFGQKAVNEGLNVTTTLDPRLQDAAETQVKNHVAANTKDWNASNAALVSTNPQTGQILAYVGGQDFQTSQVDILTSDRQPGSTIKPLIYYTAFANGYSPSTYAADWVEDFGGGYRPTDYGGRSSGQMVPLKLALAASLNIPAVHVLRGVGISKALENLDKMGFPVIKGYYYTLPLALGAVEVTPLDMAQGYATLANGGKQIKLSPILKVTDRNGKVLEDNSKVKADKQVLNAQAVAAIDSIIGNYELKHTIYAGTYFTNYTLADRPAAAKTGTSSGPKDAWTIGYTPDLLTAVWTGNTSGADLKPDADGINTAAPIWHEFMTFATQGTPVSNFPDYQPITLDQDHKYIDRKIAPKPTATPADATPTPEVPVVSAQP